MVIQTKKTSLQKQKGFLTMVAVIMIVVVGFVGIIVANLMYSSSFSTTAHYQADNALNLAESGLEHATHKLLEPTALNRSTCVGMNSTALTNTLGNGGYSVTSSGPFYAGASVAATTLSSAISSTATTIPVVTTLGYPATGRIKIDGESINYTTTTATTFNNVLRGADGTTPSAHVSGSVVSGYQCTLTAVGGVPSVSSPQGKRTLQAAVQLQEGWVVGDANSLGNYTLGRFNNPTEQAWYNYIIPGGVSLYGVFMLSYADGWFVGSNFSSHWNGTTATPVAMPVYVNYRSVYCTATNNCYAVGDNTGVLAFNPTIVSWNGSQWTQMNSFSNAVGSNLKSIVCTSASNCWSVGDGGFGSLILGYRFYLWNGTTWTGITISDASLAAAFPFNGVFCNSATDCWAVGATNTFARLTSGTNWTATSTTLPNTQYNSIYCNSSKDCWAVGNTSTTNLFVHWNGTTWSRNASSPTPLANLNSVACANTNDCWAVGSNNSTNAPAFFHWDGTGWTAYTSISNGPFSAATLRAVSIIGATTQPMSSWSETFP